MCSGCDRTGNESPGKMAKRINHAALKVSKIKSHKCTNYLLKIFVHSWHKIMLKFTKNPAIGIIRFQTFN